MCEQCTLHDVSHEQVFHHGVDVRRALAENPKLLRQVVDVTRLTVNSLEGRLDGDTIERIDPRDWKAIADSAQTATENEFEYETRNVCPNPLCERSQSAVSSELERIHPFVREPDGGATFDESQFRRVNLVDSIVSAQAANFDLTDGDRPPIEQARQLIADGTGTAEEASDMEVLDQFLQEYQHWRTHVADPVRELTGDTEQTVRDRYYDPQIEVPLSDQTITIESSPADRMAELQQKIDECEQTVAASVAAMCTDVQSGPSESHPQASRTGFGEAVDVEALLVAADGGDDSPAAEDESLLDQVGEGDGNEYNEEPTELVEDLISEVEEHGADINEPDGDESEASEDADTDDGEAKDSDESSDDGQRNRGGRDPDDNGEGPEL